MKRVFLFITTFTIIGLLQINSFAYSEKQKGQIIVNDYSKKIQSKKVKQAKNKKLIQEISGPSEKSWFRFR